jgi:dTDP-4-dehydrorhamnose reductase
MKRWKDVIPGSERVRILLFGGSGQLGFEVKKRARDLDFEVVSPVTAELDVSDRAAVVRFIATLKPEVVINSAAYTAVDKAEHDVEPAMLVNRDAAGYVAEACAAEGCRMIHISTDYVFDGSLGRELKESDATNPLSVYGRSKLEGEERVVAALGEKALILRTQALFGQKGVNFVQSMIRFFPERPSLRVVDDQWVSPTWAGWLAEVILDFVRMPASGIVHASCRGTVSWFDFACEIQKLVRPRFEGQPLAVIERTIAKDLNRPARRPTYSAFDTTHIAKLLGRAPMTWQEGLRQYLLDIGMVSE